MSFTEPNRFGRFEVRGSEGEKFAVHSNLHGALSRAREGHRVVEKDHTGRWLRQWNHRGERVKIGESLFETDVEDWNKKGNPKRIAEYKTKRDAALRKFKGGDREGAMADLEKHWLDYRDVAGPWRHEETEMAEETNEGRLDLIPDAERRATARVMMAHHKGLARVSREEAKRGDAEKWHGIAAQHDRKAAQYAKTLGEELDKLPFGRSKDDLDEASYSGTKMVQGWKAWKAAVHERHGPDVKFHGEYPVKASAGGQELMHWYDSNAKKGYIRENELPEGTMAHGIYSRDRAEARRHIGQLNAKLDRGIPAKNYSKHLYPHLFDDHLYDTIDDAHRGEGTITRHTGTGEMIAKHIARAESDLRRVPPPSGRRVKEDVDLSEGWHKDPDGTYTAWGAELSHHEKDTGRQAKCPGCGAPVELRQFHPHKDADHDVTHWDGQCVGNCGAKLRVFNDSVEEPGPGTGGAKQLSEIFVHESAPPDKEIEDWTVENKGRFKARYGKDYGRYLYGRAWRMYNSKHGG